MGNNAETNKHWQPEYRPAEVLDRSFDDVTTPFQGKRLVTEFRGLSGIGEKNLRSYIEIPARTDLWWEGTSTGANASVSVDYDLILVDD